jgi:DNA invertase Pin-like site-specific DNA recombinase
VELLRRFSNREMAVDQAKRVLERMAANDRTDIPTMLNGGTSVDAAGADPQPWRVADRLGADELDRLLADWRNGTAKTTLARRYGISLSSVKRILRRRREGEADSID